jgi:hypothetical protein
MTFYNSQKPYNIFRKPYTKSRFFNKKKINPNYARKLQTLFNPKRIY